MGEQRRGSIRGFGAPLAAALAGVTYRQLDYWARSGLARPSLVEGHGSGRARIYSYDDVFRLRVISRLLDGRMTSLRTAHRAMSDFGRYLLDDDLTHASLVLHSSGKLGVARSDDEVLDWLHRRDGALHVLPLGPLQTALDTAIRTAIEQNTPGIVHLRQRGGDDHAKQALLFAG